MAKIAPDAANYLNNKSIDTATGTDFWFEYMKNINYIPQELKFTIPQKKDKSGYDQIDKLLLKNIHNDSQIIKKEIKEEIKSNITIKKIKN